MSSREPIAIIGTACRFPGAATSPSKLWELLTHPRDVLSRIPANRFNPAGFYHEDGSHHGATNVQDSYVLSEDIRLFDAQFFNINPVEAHAIDPQQRLLLETVYESLESAGIPLEKIAGSDTAVFVGLMGEEYSTHLLRDPDSAPMYMSTGTARSIMSNRVSYFFDWHGPSVTMDTACSSSLVALHQAVQALRCCESRMAIAAGANLIIGPEPYIAESKLKMLSPGSRSRMWDINADGYARGDGIAAVVMKTLSAALEDGDHIECVIRETGVNQDGRAYSKGITVPSATAQTNLICDTYRKAGLDPMNKHDRCQFFQAHGTGTQAGDPIEAEAISHAFFGPDSRSNDEDNLLFVGGIKTVIGHTEGTAGLAGILAASLALQHGVIPPNMLFTQLNPAIEPFYHNLMVPLKPTPWPQVLDGQPRRASVNSFGFGGTNAHVILESFEPKQITSRPTASFAPFVFSAASDRSLLATMRAFVAFLRSRESINLRDLNYTLHSRRSNLPIKEAVSASVDIKDLCAQLNAKLQQPKIDGGANVGIHSTATSPRILGIFTGQGAQYAAMGHSLIIQSEFVRRSVENFDRILTMLPAPDRPTWSLKDELLADASVTRISEAELSQPLCTAIQIILVDILRSAGVSFAAVVGHSSGEIGAAYAAGYISSDDAIKIAYYRGFHAKLAGNNGIRGAMMAVGTSLKDARELCASPKLQGRICVAASNSPSSVTLSGDADAIEEVRVTMQSEKKFARLLKVDKAYHSHHMLPCQEPYVKSLRGCGIQVRRVPVCSWFSSVHGGKLMEEQDIDALGDVYWKENMCSEVLFSQAIEAAIKVGGPFNSVLEVGPHHALKGPALQTIQNALGSAIPYSGLLNREKDAVKAVSDALAFIWMRFGEPAVDFNGYDRLMSGGVSGVDGVAPTVVKDLPMYSWDHDRIFWYDSRASRAFRSRNEPIHELLGTECTEGAGEYRWKNNLRMREIPWLSGHQLQGETVFPAAGYVATALEASTKLSGGREIQLIELEDLVIDRAISFDDEDSGVEVLFSLKQTSAENGVVTGDFVYHSAANKESNTLALNARGRVRVTLGRASNAILPPQSPPAPNMVNVDENLFYSFLTDLGYGYSGPFRALSSMKRALGFGRGVISNPWSYNQKSALLVHPAMLDVAFQSSFLALCWPGDGTLRELHVPISIRRIRVNPALCRACTRREAFLPFDSVLNKKSSAIHSDVDVYPEDGQFAMLQIEGINIVPFAAGAPPKDRQIFSTWAWDVDAPEGQRVAMDNRATPREFELASFTEQASVFYLMHLKEQITEAELARSEWHHKRLLDFADHVIDGVRNGTQRFSERRWLDNTRDQIYAMMDKFPDSVELKILRAVGEHLPDAVRGKTNILEHMIQDNLLQRFYDEAISMAHHTYFLARMAEQIVHRYPKMRILEIGAGTGAATKKILKQIGQTFSSYTYTDITTGFFEKGQEKFGENSSNMIFKALDIEKDIETQGFQEHSYDLVVASLVLHATSDIERTLNNVRRLLKPGGYLLMLEITGDSPISIGFTVSGLPGWWLGGSDRRYSPCITSSQWHSALQKTGFAGVDAITPEVDVFPRPTFVIASQAVDERIKMLRQPLQASASEGSMQDLVVVGGTTLPTLRLADAVANLLRPWYSRVVRITKLEDVDSSSSSPKSNVFCLTELDEPMFKSMTSEKLKGLQQLLGHTKVALWITRGSKEADPYSSMTTGFARSLTVEMPLLTLQLLDLGVDERPPAHVLAEIFLRLHIADIWDLDGSRDDILWSNEPELRMEEGQLLIPRLRPRKSANDRYNSSMRTITQEASTETSNIRLRHDISTYSLIEGTNLTQKVSGGHSIRIRVKYSYLSAIRLPSVGSYFIVFGSNVATGKEVFALSETQSSYVDVPEDLALSCAIPPGQEVQAVLRLASELLALRLTSYSSPNAIMLLHEPNKVLADILTQKASENLLAVAYTTSTLGSMPSPWIYIHPFASERSIMLALPPNPACFVDFSKRKDAGDVDLASRISGCLPRQCARYDINSVLSDDSQVLLESPEKASQLLRDAVSSLQSHPLSSEEPKPTKAVSVGDVPNSSTAFGSATVVCWESSSPTIPIKLEPVGSKISFDSNKTYVLFGLSSDLGQSLCQWMVEHGARYVVITSRNPTVDAAWSRRLEGMGASVKICSNDITDQSALQALCRDLSSQLPPISGIVQGAMVLQDTLVQDLTVETVQKVLRPKVEGSKYLNEIFSENALDFFVFFSSSVAVFGNMGQSIYGAANMFMTNLVNQRRLQNRAASVIHIGPILGAGYVAREGRQSMLNAFQNAGYQLISERDFHQAFAEAILAGDPHSTEDPEIVLGERELVINAGTKSKLFNDPKFQRFAVREENSGMKKDSGPIASVRSRLLAARTIEEIQEIIKVAFVAKLQLSLQLSLNSEEQALITERSADELGIDSLIAVELRSWFLKELHVDMPVLRILSGATVKELFTHAYEKLPPDMTPNLKAKEEVNVPRSPSPTRGESESVVRTPEVMDPEARKISIARTGDMSFGQSRFWSVMALLEDPTTLNIAGSIRLTGKLRPDDLANAVKFVGHRHEALRTCFFVDENQRPKQGVLTSSSLHLERKQIQSTQEVSREYKCVREHVFDLARGKAMRILLLSLSDTSHFMIICHHHIAMDAMSLMIFLSDLQKVYNGQRLSPTVMQYPDYASRQQEDYRTGGMENEIKFWKKEFSDIPQPSPLLPFAHRPRRNLTRYDFEEMHHKLDPSLTLRIKETCQKNKTTPFHFYLSVFKIMLFRFLNTDDLCIGMSDANRLDSDILESIGVFLNVLPLRFRWDPKQTFSEALEEAKAKAYAALAHSKVPFDIILEELDPPRSADHSPLFQYFINYRQGIKEKGTFGECRFEIEEYQIARTPYDVVIDIMDNPGGDATITFMVKQDLYNLYDAKILMDTYMRFVSEFAADFTKRGDELVLHSKSDIEKAIDCGRGPLHEQTWPQTLVHRIDDIIHQHGGRPAIKDGTGTILSYNQMAERVHTIAAAMLARHIGNGSVVAVFQEPTVDWICSMLAIMRIGGIYVALDPKTTISRLATIVEDCKPAAILAHDATVQDTPTLGSRQGEILNISSLSSSDQALVSNNAQADEPAVILYTSGTTGTPKGIILKHSGLCNEVEGTTNIFGFGAECVLQQSSFSFDLSLWQIFIAVANGGTAFIVPKRHRGDPLGLTGLIVSENITVTGATPSEYISWFHYGSREALQSSRWNTAASGGENLPVSLLQEFKELSKPGFRLFNMYGPGEAAVASNKMEIPLTAESTYQSPFSERIPSGFTAPNYSLCIVDENMEPLPIGYPGEILLGGAGISLGYLNNEEISRQKFLPCSFASAEHIAKGWTTMYRTGDRGRLREDGAIIVEGRIVGDTQVKLRGIRIDLQDIESVILAQAKDILRDAVVTLRQSPEIFVGHVVFSRTYPPLDRESFLRKLLSTLPLPQYMCPAMLIPLDELPLSTHLKTDRAAIKALPLPETFRAAPTDVELNLSESEYQLKKLWQDTISKDITGHYEIGPGTDFFHVGGNSGLIVRLQALIRRDFGVVLPLFQLFESSTLRTMAMRIETSVPVSAIDWEKETELQQDLGQGQLSYPESSQTTNGPSRKSVLLTGATGNVGRSILRQLVDDPSVSSIHCVAVRPAHRRQDRLVLLQSDKILVYAGNLAEAHLGLTQADFEKLAGEVNVIIHIGAQRSFWDYYQFLRQPNFSSTKELVKLASTRKIPIHFISSGGVLHLASGGAASIEGSVADFKPPTDGSDGYVASKWASERYLERAAEELGLPVCIHRTVPAEGVGSPVDDVLEEFLRLAILMKTYPAAVDMGSEFDLMPLADFSHAVCSPALEEHAITPQEGNRARFIHHHAVTKLNGQGMVEYLGKKLDLGSMEEMSALEWVGKAKAEGFKYLIASQNLVFKAGASQLVSRR